MSAVGAATWRVDPAIAAEVAAAYVDGPEVLSPFVVASYAQLATESDRLFAALTDPGAPGSVRVRFSRCAAPYGSSEELITSVRSDRVLEVSVAAADRDRRHPLLDGATGGTFDRVRAVHDLLGHACLGVGFDRDGEYATWRFQERFHSPLARAALATELHAKHSVRWTTGEPGEHRAVSLDPLLLTRSRAAGDRRTP